MNTQNIHYRSILLFQKLAGKTVLLSHKYKQSHNVRQLIAYNEKTVKFYAVFVLIIEMGAKCKPWWKFEA